MWKDLVTTHPAAEMFPMMPPAELQELAHDIAKHGFRNGIVLWTPMSITHAESHKILDPIYLLDGRNRLAALEMACDNDEERDLILQYALCIDSSEEGCASLLCGDTDPYDYVVSANIRR